MRWLRSPLPETGHQAERASVLEARTSNLHEMRSADADAIGAATVIRHQRVGRPGRGTGEMISSFLIGCPSRLASSGEILRSDCIT
jgi:hypothetical protein